MQFNKSVIEIIKERKSVRTFSRKEFSAETIDSINQLLLLHKSGPLGNKMNFSLIKKEFSHDNRKVKIGTYGFISGAQFFVVGEVQNKPFCFEDYGYVLEKIILHLAEWQLGTCWLGGTFNRKALYGALNSDDEVLIPAIAPVGYKSDVKTISENLIRWAASANQRFGWEKLFFKDDFSNPVSQNNANEFAIPLEMVRLAPSASNKQPWRIVIEDNALHFYLKRTPGYKKAFKAIDLQRVDMGIAMAHFELTCCELQLKGSWEFLDPEIPQSDDKEYFISWKFR